MLTDTALVITAWKRPEYLEQALASWSGCPEVRSLRMVAVALGRSHRRDDMMDVIREGEKALGRTFAVWDDSDEAAASPGMHRALGEAVDRAVEAFRVEWVLCGEEDVVVSDDALSYVSWAQAQWEENTLCACLHNRGGAGWDGLAELRKDGDADQRVIWRRPYFNPWGWCTWQRTWRTVIRPVWDWDCDSGGDQDSGYDWNLQRLSSQGPWHNLVPEAARSQTIGELNGVYSNPDIFQLQQSLSFRHHRGPVAYRLGGF